MNFLILLKVYDLIIKPFMLKFFFFLKLNVMSGNDETCTYVKNNEFGSFERHTKGIGMKILKKWGYKGGGLGKDEKGILEPILVRKRKRRQGLHHKELDPNIDSNFVDFTENTYISQETEHINLENIPFENVQSESEFKVHHDLPVDSKPQTEKIIFSAYELEEIDQYCNYITDIIENYFKEFVLISNDVLYHDSYSTLTHEQSTLEDDNKLIDILELDENSSNPMENLRKVEVFIQKCIELENATFLQVKKAFQELQYILGDYYEKCHLNLLSFALSYFDIIKTIESWKFSHHLPDCSLESIEYNIDTFLEWKYFFQSQMAFKTHHVWSQIVMFIFRKLYNFFNQYWSNITLENITDSQLDYDINLLTAWHPYIAMDDIISSVILNRLQEFVENWCPNDDNSKLLTILSHFDNVFGKQMEDIHISMYNKLFPLFSQENNNENIIKKYGQLLLQLKENISIVLDLLSLNLIVPNISKYLNNLDMETIDLSKLTAIEKVFEWGNYISPSIMKSIIIDDIFPLLTRSVEKLMKDNNVDYDIIITKYTNWKSILKKWKMIDDIKIRKELRKLLTKMNDVLDSQI